MEEEVPLPRGTNDLMVSTNLTANSTVALGLNVMPTAATEVLIPPKLGRNFVKRVSTRSCCLFWDLSSLSPSNLAKHPGCCRRPEGG